MRSLLWALSLLLVSSHWSVAQEPNVRASLVANEKSWAGEKVVLVVELLAPGYFASAATFDLPDPPSLLLMPPFGSPVVSSEEVGGESYSVQRHEVAIFAQRAGDLTIPPITVRFQFKRAPLDKETIPASVKTAPISFEAKAPPGSESLGRVLSARALTVRETWNPEVGANESKMGDAFTRTITFSAVEIPGMLFPPFHLKPIDGLGIYSKAPIVFDHRARGALTGERCENIVYLCQRPGRFEIPAVRYTWFDLESKKLQVVDLPARTINVANTDDSKNRAVRELQLTQPDGSRAALQGLAGAFGFNVCALFVWQYRQAFMRLLLPLRPVHLSPLNPVTSEKPVSRSN